MKQIRVMLVDDSILFLRTLQSALEKEADILVVGTAMDGQEALDTAPGLCPDVILCDVQMPKMSGLEFVKRLLPIYPVPVVVISGTPGVTLSALKSGAVDFIQKPTADETSANFFARVITTVRTASVANIKAKMAAKKAAMPQDGLLLTGTPPNVVVCIGASTGGTDAILAVVRNLPENFPPVLVTQHMPAVFTTMYAERMNKECKMRVREVHDGDRLETGLLLLAAGGYQMRLCKDAQGYYASSQQGEKVNGHIPSVGVLFDSAAKIAKKCAVGVILTGMGSDGAEGLLRMRTAGARTFGQDKATSVVYGMPMAAYNMGAVEKQLPLDEMAAELVRCVNGMR